jgi:GAF domain-containing protein
VSVEGLSPAAQQYTTQGRLGAEERYGQLCGPVALLLTRVGAVSVSPLLVYLCYRAWIRGSAWPIAAYLLALSAVLFAAFRGGVSYRARSAVLLVVLNGLALIAYFREQSVGQAQVFLVTGTALATLLLGRRAGLVSLLAGVLLSLSARWVTMGSEGSRIAWAQDTLSLAAMGGTLVFAVDHVVAGLTAAASGSERRAGRLRVQRGDLVREREELEQRVALLARQNEWLRATASVALDVDPRLEEGELLERAARLTSEQFGFFHVGIFVLDPTGEWAELRAASSEGGKRMLARRHRLRLGQEGLIGHVTARGEPRISADVDADALYYENPDLPETRSELAVPLRHEGHVIGAFDIQQRTPDAFHDEDVVAIQMLADLVAAALGSAGAIAQLRQSAAAERRSHGQLSAQAWAKRARTSEAVGYRYDQGSVSQLVGLRTEASEDGQEGVMEAEKQAWPLGVHGRLVGSVEAHKYAEQGEWSSGERELMQTVVEQLGAALENARLYEEAQFRASGDRLVADVTGRIRETLQLDTVMRTVAEEVYHALGLDEIVVHLVPPDAATDPRGEG